MDKIAFEDTWLGMLAALVSLSLFVSTLALICGIITGAL